MKKMVLTIVLSWSLAAYSVQAAPISFHFSGEWTSVSGANQWFTSGGQFEGSVAYDSDLPVVGTSASYAAYQGSQPSNFATLSFATHGWSGSLNNIKIKIVNNSTVSGLSGVTDQFAISHPTGAGSTLPDSLPAFASGMFNLTDRSGQIFSDTSLPNEAVMTSLPLGSMFSRTFMLAFQDGSFASGRITEITAPRHPTPEPSTLLLFAPGLAGVLGLSAAHKKLSRSPFVFFKSPPCPEREP